MAGAKARGRPLGPVTSEEATDGVPVSTVAPPVPPREPERRAGSLAVVADPVPPATYERLHEDVAWFRRCESYLAELMSEAEGRAALRGPHGRRFAIVRTALEASWLQAGLGAKEAHYHQGASGQ